MKLLPEVPGMIWGAGAAQRMFSVPRMAIIILEPSRKNLCETEIAAESLQ